MQRTLGLPQEGSKVDEPVVSLAVHHHVLLAALRPTSFVRAAGRLPPPPIRYGGVGTLCTAAPGFWVPKLHK